MSYYSVKDGIVRHSNNTMCSDGTLKRAMMKGGSIVYDMYQDNVLFFPKGVMSNRPTGAVVWGQAVNVSPKEIQKVHIPTVAKAVKQKIKSKEDTLPTSTITKPKSKLFSTTQSANIRRKQIILEEDTKLLEIVKKYNILSEKAIELYEKIIKTIITQKIPKDEKRQAIIDRLNEILNFKNVKSSREFSDFRELLLQYNTKFLFREDRYEKSPFIVKEGSNITHMETYTKDIQALINKIMLGKVEKSTRTPSIEIEPRTEYTKIRVQPVMDDDEYDIYYDITDSLSKYPKNKQLIKELYDELDERNVYPKRLLKDSDWVLMIRTKMNKLEEQLVLHLREKYKNLPDQITVIDKINKDRYPNIQDRFKKLQEFDTLDEEAYTEYGNIIIKLEETTSDNESIIKELLKLLQLKKYKENWTNTDYVVEVLTKMNELEKSLTDEQKVILGIIEAPSKVILTYSKKAFDTAITDLEDYSNIYLESNTTLASKANYETELSNSVGLVVLIKDNKKRDENFTKLVKKIDTVKERAKNYIDANANTGLAKIIRDTRYFGINKLNRTECEKIFSDKKYKKGETLLGQGTFGQVGPVCQGYDDCQTHEDNYKYVVKIQDINKRTETVIYNNEVRLNKILQSKGLAVNFIDDWTCTEKDNDYGFIIMDRWDGTLEQYHIKERTKEVPAENIKQLFNQLNGIHENGIFQNDIKSNNIFYKKKNDGSFDFIIADFGISEEFVSNNPKYKYLNETEKIYDFYSLYDTLPIHNNRNIFKQYFTAKGDEGYVFDINDDYVSWLALDIHKGKYNKFIENINDLLFSPRMVQAKQEKIKEFNKKARELKLINLKSYKNKYNKYNLSNNVLETPKLEKELENYLQSAELSNQQVMLGDLFKINVKDKCDKLDNTCGTDSKGLCKKKLEEIVKGKNLTDKTQFDEVMTDINILIDGIKKLVIEYISKKTELLNQLKTSETSKKEIERLKKLTCMQLEIELEIKKNLQMSEQTNKKLISIDIIKKIFSESEKPVEQADKESLKDCKTNITSYNFEKLHKFEEDMIAKYPPHPVIVIKPDPPFDTNKCDEYLTLKISKFGAGMVMHTVPNSDILSKLITNSKNEQEIINILTVCRSKISTDMLNNYLVLAIKYKKINVIKFILNQRTDYNKLFAQIDTKNIQKSINNLLNQSIKEKNFENINLLIKLGADFNPNNYKTVAEKRPDFIALLHTTSLKNFESIYKNKYLYGIKEQYQGKTAVTSGLTFKGYDTTSGVYFRILYNKLNDKTINYNIDMPIILVFSLKLLERRDYYVNLLDQLGILTKNSYGKDTITEMPRVDTNSTFKYPNEVMFNNKVSLNYLEEIWCEDETTCDIVKRIVGDNVRVKIVTEYPSELQYNKNVKEEGNNLPLFCNALGTASNQDSPKLLNSLSTYKKIALNCGIERATIDKINSINDVRTLIYNKLLEIVKENPQTEYKTYHYPPFNKPYSRDESDEVIDRRAVDYATINKAINDFEKDIKNFTTIPSPSSPPVLTPSEKWVKMDLLKKKTHINFLIRTFIPKVPFNPPISARDDRELLETYLSILKRITRVIDISKLNPKNMSDDAILDVIDEIQAKKKQQQKGGGSSRKKIETYYY